MQVPDKAGSFAVWLLGVALAALVARVGWELGGVVWGLF